MGRHLRHTPSEEGAAALELALAAPIVLILAAGCSTLAGYLHQTFEVDSAATAAARYLMNRPGVRVSDQALESYLDEAFPGLGFGEGDATVHVSWTGREKTSYAYRLYEGGEATDVDASFESERFDVTVEASAVLPGISYASGDGQTKVSSTKSGETDQTGGEQWQ